ncbi:MAG: hypothetical protein DBX40_06165 [Clostridiales bacterium]|nr:MAG: hypothetical protein DBX40_06165 [Clostridiales bacterium]
MQGNNNALKNGVNLVPRKLLIYQKLKIVQWIVLGLCLVALALMTVFAVQGYMQIDDLNKELAEDKQIIAEGHLDELNALKEQYDNLILGIDSGNITLIPDIDTKMTELFSIITKHKPNTVELVGVDGQLKSTGEYTYRMEYSSTDRTVISGFLEKLQGEKLEYINISTISKAVEDENVQWMFSITVKIGGIAE